MFTVLQVGCSASEEANEDPKQVVDETETNAADESEDEETLEADVGEFSIAYRNNELEEMDESGPVEVKVHKLQMNELEVADEHKEVFQNKDETTVLIFDLEITNTSDDRVYFFTNDAELATDTGETAVAEKMLSELVGDPLDGGASREGNIVFLLDTEAGAINEVKLTFDNTQNVDNEPIGEPITFTFSLND